MTRGGTRNEINGMSKMGSVFIQMHTTHGTSRQIRGFGDHVKGPKSPFKPAAQQTISISDAVLAILYHERYCYMQQYQYFLATLLI